MSNKSKFNLVMGLRLMAVPLFAFALLALAAAYAVAPMHALATPAPSSVASSLSH